MKKTCTAKQKIYNLLKEPFAVKIQSPHVELYSAPSVSIVREHRQTAATTHRHSVEEVKLIMFRQQR